MCIPPLRPTLITVLLVLWFMTPQAHARDTPNLEPLAPGADAPDEDAPKATLATDGSVSHRIGLRFGLNYSILGRPDDDPDDPTLLSGSAFTGPGFVIGPSWEIVGLGLPMFSLETGLLYTRSTATGFEERDTLKRDILLEVTTLRLPLWFKIRAEAVSFGPVRLVAGVGVDALIGVTSASTVREDNVPATEVSTELETMSVTAFHLGALAGLELDLDEIVVPIMVHGSFNPGVGASTTDRYQDYGGAADPGPYRMEFDYEVLVLLGIMYAL
ncbi:MAG: hypothetical protein AAFX99_14805 [Myxococcota bacterium]